jgi:uncharacterized protein
LTSHFVGGAVIGIAVGLVSSLLGVAGGELLIPALILVFGADIKTAGSASILISLGVVLIGLWRHWRAGTIPLGRGAQRITTAMTGGSIIGASAWRIGGRLCAGRVPERLARLCLIGGSRKTLTHKT